MLAPASVSRADGDLDKDTPPSSPIMGEETKFTEVKPYNFYRSLKFQHKPAKDIHSGLKKGRKWPIPSVHPNIKALEELKVYNEIRGLLGASGLSYIFRDDPGSYPEVTFEFLCSFVSVIEVNEEGEKKVKSWRFSMNDDWWEIDSAVLCDWFRLPRDGWYLRVFDEEAFAFWKKITGREYTKEKEHKTTSIKFPVWKIIHRLIAGNIFIRAKYGRMVTKDEMMLMLKIEEGVKIDWLWCMTQGLINSQSFSDNNRGLGGGSIVTIIAKKLKYTFDEGGEVEKLDLDHKRMRAMHILGRGLTWKIPKDSDSDEEDEEDAEGDKIEDGIEKDGNPGSSGISSMERKLDLLLQQQAEDRQLMKTILLQQEMQVQCQNSLCYYVAEHYKWEEKFLTKLVADLKCSSAFEPPPRCPFIPKPANFEDPIIPPPSTSNKGKDKVHDPPPLTQDSAEASIRDVLDSVRANERMYISDDEESLRAVEYFIVSPPRGNEAVGVVPEGEQGKAIDDIDREGAIDAVSAPAQAASPSISAELE